MNEPAHRPTPARALPSRNVFDENAYLLLHPDVAAAIGSGIVDSGWQHFTLHGFAEGRPWVPKPDALVGVAQDLSPHDEMFYGNRDHYFDVGESALHCIEAALATARRDKSSVRQILDLPCGHGRVLRFLKQGFPEARLTACDLNGDGVRYCAKVFGATPVLSKVEIGDIPLNGEFDLIWCGSLLTHLPEGKCAAFLQLFQRQLRPGGILVFTTHGRHCAHELRTGKNKCGLDDGLIANLLAQYHRSGFGYVDYSPGSGYGISLALPSWVLATFVQPAGWKLLGYHEGGWDRRQDVIALQKDPVPAGDRS